MAVAPSRHQHHPATTPASVFQRLRMGRDDWIWVALGILVLVGFLLRLRGLHQSIVDDEIGTLKDVQGRGFSQLIDFLASGSGAPTTTPHAGILQAVPAEQSPPLYFILAWVSAKLGDPTVLIRLPSLVLGSATIPLLYALGLRTVGRRAALIAAALIALSPFAIFYSVEARPYATLMFLSVVSTLALLRASEPERSRWWWVVYAATASAAIYTHYTAIFVLGGQAVWALVAHREHWRALVLALGAAALSFVPWLPHVHGFSAVYVFIARVLGLTHGAALLTWLNGTPDIPLHRSPGTGALVLLGVGVGVGIAGLAARAWTTRGSTMVWRPSRELVLVLVLALATLIGIELYDRIAHNVLFLFPRNLSASLPFALLVLGWVVTRPEPRTASVASGLALAGVAIGAVGTLDDTNSRPPVRAVAHFLDQHAAASETVFLRAAPSANESVDLLKTIPLYGPRSYSTGSPASPIGFELRHQWDFQGRSGIAVGEYVRPATVAPTAGRDRVFMVVLDGVRIQPLPSQIR
jgi:Dolichyl-phosphate-mannose-protein mannosyltransferase